MCGMVLESKQVHDFRMCGCPNQTFVDGGDQYKRFGAKDLKQVELQPIEDPSPKNARQRGPEGREE